MILNPTEQSIALYAILYMLFIIGIILAIKSWPKKTTRH